MSERATVMPAQASGRTGLRTLLAYGAGQTGAQLFRDTPAVLLPVFMTTILGVQAWLAGLVVLVPKLWVIVCDPLMGAWSDRLNARHGRTPFLVAGGVVTGLAFAALFAFAGYPSPAIAALAVALLFFVGCTAFSAFSVPYLALVSEMSPDPHERTRILVFRMVFSVAGVILGVGLAQPIVFHLGGDAPAWRTMGLAFGTVCLASMLVTALGLRGRVRRARASGNTPGLLARLAQVRANRPYVVLTGVNFVLSVSQACSFSAVGFVFIYVVQEIDLLLPFILVMAVGGLTSQPFWLAWSRRVGKRRGFVYGSVAWIAITLTWLDVGPGDDVLVTLPLWGELSTQHALVLLRGFLIGVTNAGFVLLATSMMTDTLEAERRARGRVDEGTYSGVFVAIEKLAFAVGPLIGGLVLSVAGFRSSTTGVIAQGDGALLGIVLLYSVVPATLQVLALLLLTRYRLPHEARA